MGDEDEAHKDIEGRVLDESWRPRRRRLVRASILVPFAAFLLLLVLYLVSHEGGYAVSQNPTNLGLSNLSRPELSHIDNDESNLSIQLHRGHELQHQPQQIDIEWNITKQRERPDGVAKQVYLINGQSPGPTVEAQAGDTIAITVRNLLENTEDVTLHFHGVHVTNDMDGVPGLTQCPVKAGGTFKYRIELSPNQSGTFWYHSHSETQRADGLYGPFIVHPRTALEESEKIKYDYEDDQVLMIGDHYHRPAEEVLDYFMDWRNFKIEPAPDSMLLNGKGIFHCSMAVPAQPVDCNKVNVPHLILTSSRTRLRVINTGALTGFTVSAESYAFNVIKVDGGNDISPVRPVNSFGTLHPGERIDVVIQRVRNDDDRPGSLTVKLDKENLRYPNLALTATQTFPIFVAANQQPSEQAGRDSKMHQGDQSGRVLDLKSVKGVHPSHGGLPLKADRTLVLYTTITYLAINSERPKGTINHTTWSLSEPLTRPLLAIDRDEWPANPSPFIPSSDGVEWIDIVINNVDDNGHPFHLHGNDFYVIGYHAPDRLGAYDLYNPFDHSKEPAGGPMNLINPLKKDTVYVPSMGYVVLRFQASNPGLWLLHCHVLWHQSVGMAMAIQVEAKDDESWTALAKSSSNSCNG